MSRTEQLLSDLGALEREYDETFPHEWEDVVRGDRTAQEVMAAREGQDDPEELRALAEVLTPISDEERNAWVDRLAEAVAQPAPNAGDAEDPAAEPEAGAQVVSLDERRRSRAWLAAGATVLIAAALLLWLVPRTQGPAPTEPGGVTLPGFSLTVRNETVQEIRSDSTPTEGVAPYLPTSQIDWVIRPERSIAEPVEIRILAEGASRMLITPQDAEVSERGVVRLRGTIEDTLGLSPGRWSLRILVGAPASLPDDLEAFDRGGDWIMTDAYGLEVLSPR